MKCTLSHFQVFARCSVRVTATTRMVSAAATPAGRASSVSCVTTSASQLIATDTESASTESAPAPGDSEENSAKKVSFAAKQ